MEENQMVEKANELAVSYDIEDFELEGLGFKPINAGLGFHGEREKVRAFKTPAQTKHSRTNRLGAINSDKLQHTPEAMPLSSATSGLEAFYAQSNTNEVKKAASDTKTIEATKEATLSSRLFSYVIDCMIVGITVLSMYFVFSLIAYGEISFSSYKTFIVTNGDFLFLLSFITYISYFTLLDAIGTVGKKLFGIRLEVTGDESHLSVIQVFNRTILCLLGTLLAFVPCILDLHGKLSRTRVVVRND
jgi:uncharacterized RDD family membrane protein YckC